MTEMAYGSIGTVEGEAVLSRPINEFFKGENNG